jgi:tetratricopeptide (TPR) repeat protein
MSMKTNSGRPRFLQLAVCAFLFFCTTLLFSHAIPHEFLDLDDGDYVTGNPVVQEGLTWHGVRWALTANVAANWHPLTLLSHMTDCQLFGDNPHWHHAVNVFWHALNAVMAFVVLRRLTGAFWTSALSAALFAWHPLRVESVAWISERKDVLSVFFALVTLWAYAIYVEKRGANSGGAWRYFGLALAAFICGLLCKPMLVTLPFVLLLLDGWPLRRVAGNGFMLGGWLPLVVEKVPFFLLSLASSVVTYLAQKDAGAVGDTFPANLRFANAVVSVMRYIGKVFWPFDLAVGYPLSDHLPAREVLLAVAMMLGISGLVVMQRKQMPWLFVGWFWFLGMLVPVLGLVQAGLQSMADRYAYLPSLGLQLAILWTVRAALPAPALRRFVPAFVALLLGCCAFRTWDQLGVWKDSLTLHQHSLAVTERNYLAHFYLGTTLLNQQHFPEAEAEFRRALEIKPDFTADQYRLGVTLEKMGRTEEARAVYEEVIKSNPGYGIADYSLGELLLEHKQPALAVPYLKTALRIKPDYDPALVALGSALSELGQPQEAVHNYEQALALNPVNTPAHYDCGNALMDLQKYPEALAHYQAALRLDPGFESARCNCGNALRALNRPDEAISQYQLALKSRPDDANAHYGMGAALEDSGRTEEALASYNAALQIRPDYAAAHYDVGAILLNLNQPSDALGHFQAALKSRPRYEQACLGLGLAQAQLGRQAEAIASYDQVLAINPANSDALCCLGVALRREGRILEAIPYYQRAVAAKPDSAEAHAELGKALCQTGHSSDGIPHLKQALKLRPDFPGLTEAFARAQQEILGANK